MHRLLIDNDFRAPIVEALTRELGDLDIVTLREAGLERSPDDAVLRFACAQRRILLSHDVRTMPQAVYSLTIEEELTPRVLLVPQRTAIARAAEETALVLAAGNDVDWQNGVVRLPL